MKFEDIAEIDWLEPWGAVREPISRGLEAELERETEPGHPLYGCRGIAVGRRFDQDEVLYLLPEHSYPLAVVHLLWRDKVQGEDRRWPRTVFYSTVEEWRERCLKPANHEFCGTW